MFFASSSAICCSALLLSFLGPPWSQWCSDWCAFGCSAAVAFGCVCSSHVSGWPTSVEVFAVVPLEVSCFLSCRVGGYFVAFAFIAFSFSSTFRLKATCKTVVLSTPSPPANDGTARRGASPEERRTVRSLRCGQATSARGAGRAPGRGSFCPRRAWSVSPPTLSAPLTQALWAVHLGGGPPHRGAVSSHHGLPLSLQNSSAKPTCLSDIPGGWWREGREGGRGGGWGVGACVCGEGGKSGGSDNSRRVRVCPDT